MNKQMENLMYLLLHFLTGQTRPERSRRMWQSGIVVHDAPGMCLATAGAATPAAAADTARRNGEENDAAICAECGHGVAFGSGRFVNRAPIFDSYDARCEMGYSYPAMKASSVPLEWHGAVPFGSDDDATSGEVLERQRASQ
jgi:hypothetical protein